MSNHEKKSSIYEGKYCCEAMDVSLQEPEIFGIYYDEKFREYTVDMNGVGFKMKYCPSCGTKLPVSLRKKWFDELSKILGFEVDVSIDKRKVPKEFISDIWWKKRGL